MTAPPDITALVVEYFWALDARRSLTGREDTAVLADVTSALQRAESSLREAVGAASPADPRANARLIAAFRDMGRQHQPPADWQDQVLACVQARRPSWVRRAWQRLAGGRS